MIHLLDFPKVRVEEGGAKRNRFFKDGAIA
jgi:hypothetical protein